MPAARLFTCTMVEVAPSPAAISSITIASEVWSMPAPPHSSGIATPASPIAASSASASRGKRLWRSHSAAFGRRCSRAKRRTVSRIISCCSEGAMSVGLDVGHGMVGEKPAGAVVTLRGTVDTAAAGPQDARRAIDVFGDGGRKERRIQLRGEGVEFDAEAALDREPHGAVGGRHERRPVDDAPGPLEALAVRPVQRAAAVADLDHPKAIEAHEARPVDHLF